MKILPASEGQFTARIKTTENGALFLAQQFLDAIELIDPPETKEKFEARLRRRLHEELQFRP
jgi:hypothetical protein